MQPIREDRAELAMVGDTKTYVGDLAGTFDVIGLEPAEDFSVDHLSGVTITDDRLD